MRFTLDFNRDRYLFPHKRIEKLFALAGYLFETHSRSLQTLCRNLEKSEEQIRRDLKALSEYYEAQWDAKNNPTIVSDQLKKKDEHFELIEMLKGVERKSISELAAHFKVDERTIDRWIKSLEKFFDLDYDFEHKPFIF